MKIENIKKAIETYCASHLPKSKQVYSGANITQEQIAAHRTYAPVSDDEKVLLLVNKVPTGLKRFVFCTGLCITERFVYYKLMKDTFVGNFQSKIKGVIPIENVTSIGIGERDHCFGSSYEGHQLLINGRVIGLLRMGTGMTEDEDMIEQLRQLFKNFTNE